MNEPVEEIRRIAEFFREEGYSKTSKGVISLVKTITKGNPTIDYETYVERASSIPGIFRDEFSEFCAMGQEFRGQCFDEALMMLFESQNKLGERSRELFDELVPFASRIRESDDSIQPMAEFFSHLLVKKSRSAEESLRMFHSACYIYLIGVEGVLDEVAKILYGLVEAAKGKICRFEELETIDFWKLHDAYKRTFGKSPIFLKNWREKKGIRNAIAHAQAQFNPWTDQAHFKSKIDNGQIFEATMSFYDFQALHMEIIDSIDSFRYSLRLLGLTELLMSAYSRNTKSPSA